MSKQLLRQLEIFRTIGYRKCHLGTLAQNRYGIYFQYATDYLEKYPNPAPFTVDFSAQLHEYAFNQLPPFLIDSLPDSWGLQLMDRFFRRNGRDFSTVTALEKLAFVGGRTMGSLSFEPTLLGERGSEFVELAELGREAEEIFSNGSNTISDYLAVAGTSGGSRPKASIWMNSKGQCSLSAFENSIPSIIKFPSMHVPLGLEEGVCEMVYADMAKAAGLWVMPSRLIDLGSGKKAFTTTRFDYEGSRRVFVASVAGLLDADWRTPCLDISSIIALTNRLCFDYKDAQRVLCQAIFNLLSCNQDDHAKNWAFLQEDNGHWRFAPSFDITFSPSPYGEHTMSYAGFGKKPTPKAMQKLAYTAQTDLKKILPPILEGISRFSEFAQNYEMSATLTKKISKTLNQIYNDNKNWIGS